MSNDQSVKVFLKATAKQIKWSLVFILWIALQAQAEEKNVNSQEKVQENVQTGQPAHVSLTEADGYISIFGGANYYNSVQGNFVVNGGYRFLKNYPRIGLGADFGYLRLTSSDQLIAVTAHAEYAFENENKGLVTGFGLGYATSNTTKGFCLAPSVQYYYPILSSFAGGDLGLGGRGAFNIVLGSPLAAIFSLDVGLRFWW